MIIAVNHPAAWKQEPFTRLHSVAEDFRAWAPQRQGHWLSQVTGDPNAKWQPITRAITIRQPWAWAILSAGKDIENRSRKMAPPGWYLLHAAKGMTLDEYEAATAFISRITDRPIPRASELLRGGIIGAFQITGWTPDSQSPWFVGQWGAEIGVALPLPGGKLFVPCAGALGVFTPNLTGL